MAGEVKSLDTNIMNESIISIQEQVKLFEEARKNIDSTTNDLLSQWVGESRNSFEKKYQLLSRNLKDIGDSLYDFYDSIVNSATSYIEADEELSKKIQQ